MPDTNIGTYIIVLKIFNLFLDVLIVSVFFILREACVLKIVKSLFKCFMLSLLDRDISISLVNFRFGISLRSSIGI